MWQRKHCSNTAGRASEFVPPAPLRSVWGSKKVGGSDQLLQSYQQKMLNTSALLKQLNEQFTWVSQLANLTQSDDQHYLQVFTVSPCWPCTAATPSVRPGGRVVLPWG